MRRCLRRAYLDSASATQFAASPDTKLPSSQTDCLSDRSVVAKKAYLHTPGSPDPKQIVRESFSRSCPSVARNFVLADNGFDISMSARLYVDIGDHEGVGCANGEDGRICAAWIRRKPMQWTSAYQNETTRRVNSSRTSQASQRIETNILCEVALLIWIQRSG